MNKYIVMAGLLAASSAVSAAGTVKIGMLQGFTGPTESLVAPMALGGEMAIKEVSDSGQLLGGMKVESVRGDSTCIDAAAATAAAERLITSDGVAAINGATCSGATTAVLNNVAVPNGVVMISPSATSPALSTIADKDLFFRTAPSDARQGQVLADVIKGRGHNSIAITYTNNDYGKGLADSIKQAFEAAGGKVTIIAAHEDGKADYSAEIGALSSAGGDMLVVAGYLDQGGKGIIRAALDTGAFDKFVLPDGMVGDALAASFGTEFEGSFGTVPGTDSPGAKMMGDLSSGKGFNGTDPYVPECYDASALILLAMQSAKSTDSTKFNSHIMRVANAPGKKIYPGELAKALKILAAGGEIDYVGGTAVELVGSGESAGAFREVEIKGGKFTTVKYH